MFAKRATNLRLPPSPVKFAGMMRFFIVFLVCFYSCAHRPLHRTQQYAPAPESSAPVYSNLSYWAAHPWKPDAADSIPADLRGEQRDSLADVFFIYPTTYTGQKDEWNASVNDPVLNAKTDYSSILYQASVFNQHCRVFAPRYRQVHLSAFYSDAPEAMAALDTAYADVKEAFEFYLTHYNNGRPIIIAGHSQGAHMSQLLVKEFFDGTPLYRQLVAAYIIGWPVPENKFAQVPSCKTPGQTGCFCSWRTYREGYVPEYIQKEKPVAVVTNPLTWTTENTAAPPRLNNGSVLRNFSKVIKGTTGAQVHGGVLWVRKPRFPGGAFFNTRNYHIADINLFYVNIRQNAGQRIREFLEQQ